MNKQIWTWIILIAVVVLVIVLVTGQANNMPEFNLENGEEGSGDESFMEEKGSAPAQSSNTNSRSTTPAPVSIPRTSQPVNQVALHTVKFLDSGGYLPKTIQAKVGDVVFFNNVGSKDMLTISNDYPGSGSDVCGTSSEALSLNQCRIGKTYSFTLKHKGVWTYYNQSTPHLGGTIIVQ